MLSFMYTILLGCIQIVPYHRTAKNMVEIQMNFVSRLNNSINPSMNKPIEIVFTTGSNELKDKSFNKSTTVPLRSNPYKAHVIFV